MTELETLERARMYMEKLSRGINPIDDTAVPAGEALNHVRLSKCFSYVEEVLRQVIARGGVTAQTTGEKISFALPIEKRSAYEYSQTPIPVSEIARRINALLENPAMATLSYAAIRDWLFSLGMLQEIQDANGKNATRPTQMGASMGITTENRVGVNGPYVVTVYDAQAQRFVLDNLDDILELKNSRRENKDQPWTYEQDAQLMQMHDQGASVKEMSIHLRRTPGGVRTRLEQLIRA